MIKIFEKKPRNGGIPAIPKNKFIKTILIKLLLKNS
jgi:hypothetical protein